MSGFPPCSWGRGEGAGAWVPCLESGFLLRSEGGWRDCSKGSLVTWVFWKERGGEAEE